MQIFPSGVEVIRGQVNRVPEPAILDFIVLTPMRKTRLSTNVDSYTDAWFPVSVVGEEMTVASVDQGQVFLGSAMFNANAATILSQISGTPGGAGVYKITTGHNGFSGLIYAGVALIRQSVQYDIQLDIHGPASADNAQIISTLFRDEYATNFFKSLGIGEISPLFTSDPHQVPFINGESQWEYRWSLDASFQVNATVQVPQEFADQLATGLIDVDAVYPP